MATPQRLKTLRVGESCRMDLLVDKEADERYSAVMTYDGTQGGEPFFIPPHWHKHHDEYITVLEGRILATVEGKTTVRSAGDGALFVPRRAVHSFRGFPGEKAVVEERNEPAGIYKALFFNDVFQNGEFPGFWLGQRANLDGDGYFHLPVNNKLVDELFVLIFGYIAKLFVPARPKTL